MDCSFGVLRAPEVIADNQETMKHVILSKLLLEELLSNIGQGHGQQASIRLFWFQWGVADASVFDGYHILDDTNVMAVIMDPCRNLLLFVFKRFQLIY